MQKEKKNKEIKKIIKKIKHGEKKKIFNKGCSINPHDRMPMYSLVQWESQSVVVRLTYFGWFVFFRLEVETTTNDDEAPS